MGKHDTIIGTHKWQTIGVYKNVMRKIEKLRSEIGRDEFDWVMGRYLKEQKKRFRIEREILEKEDAIKDLKKQYGEVI